MLQFVFDDLQHLLISMARSFKYFHNVELLYPSDEFQTLWIFNMFTCLYSIPWYMWPTLSWGLNLNMWTCWRSKVFEIRQIRFAFILHQQRPVFISAHAQNFFSWSLAKKNLAGKRKLLSLQDSYRVSKVANERYLTYLQFCEKALLRILMYFGCKSGRKLR